MTMVNACDPALASLADIHNDLVVVHRRQPSRPVACPISSLRMRRA
jgi:hypothetical protein